MSLPEPASIAPGLAPAGTTALSAAGGRVDGSVACVLCCRRPDAGSEHEARERPHVQAHGHDSAAHAPLVARRRRGRSAAGHPAAAPSESRTRARTGPATTAPRRCLGPWRRCPHPPSPPAPNRAACLRHGAKQQQQQHHAQPAVRGGVHHIGKPHKHQRAPARCASCDGTPPCSSKSVAAAKENRGVSTWPTVKFQASAPVSASWA